MRKAAIVIIVYFSLHAGSLYAVCKSDACKKATAWKNGYTAIVLDDNISRADYSAVLDAVKANSGVVAIEAERVLLGWVPITKAGNLRATRGVSAVLYEAVARPSDLVHRNDALAALSFFNRVRNGTFEDEVEKGLAVVGEPLINCTVRPNTTHSQALFRRTTSVDSATEEHDIEREGWPNLTIDYDPMPKPHLGGVVHPQWGGQTPFRNPDMRGRVTVQLFRLDSDGTSDPNTYTWTSDDFNQAWYQTLSAFTFWVDQASLRGITLSFRVTEMDPLNRHTRAIVPTATRYEPITHSSADDYLWINDALAANGYGASPLTPTNVYNQNDAFNLNMAADPFYGPFDRSFSVYLVYNPLGAPAHFAGTSQGAYTPLDGPYVMMLWNSNGWGPANIGKVLTHETGHIFWACDEYAAGCGNCDVCVAGPSPRPWANNANCDDPNSTGSCLVPRTSCVMKDLGPSICPFTPNQIGW